MIKLSNWMLYLSFFFYSSKIKVYSLHAAFEFGRDSLDTQIMSWYRWLRVLPRDSCEETKIVSCQYLLWNVEVLLHTQIILDSSDHLCKRQKDAMKTKMKGNVRVMYQQSKQEWNKSLLSFRNSDWKCRETKNWS